MLWWYLGYTIDLWYFGCHACALVLSRRLTVSKIIRCRNIRLNGKDQRQYLVRFKNQTADKDKWLAEDAKPDGNIHLRRFRATRWTEQSHQ
ncbi:hypothetical protein O181_096900 [Austropuccinia psidii MF-1]|uniref:Uncharacterized protein n=1 Tax=Austropuccinia psidii MF-1 TaxID=1389203 RepID=A0A9Q3J8I3_9BASI|nr:hypothetical protein [Austropuccinia psidii MF-1]